MRDFIEWLDVLPEWGIYAALWLGAAMENVVPAVPADTFVALGGFLAGAEIAGLQVRWVFVGTWIANVGGALTIYRVSHRYGRPFFDRGMGRYLLKPHQMERVAAFYDRWGALALFLSRFLPGIRAVVPVFAGATHQGWWRVAVPVSVASGIWYGGLVYLGGLAGRNVAFLERLLGGLNRWLALAATVIGAAVLFWWLRTRHAPGSDGAGDE